MTRFLCNAMPDAQIIIEDLTDILTFGGVGGARLNTVGYASKRTGMINRLARTPETDGKGAVDCPVMKREIVLI